MSSPIPEPLPLPMPPPPQHSPNHHLHHLHHSPRRAVDLRIPAIEKYAYCLCLHVKPTTIFIAVFKLIRALLFASLLLNTEFAFNDQGQEITLAGLEDRHRATAVAMSILSRIVMASVSAVGIYAVVSGRAALLMPLYAMLLCDFFFSLPAFYSRDIEFAEGNGFSELKSQHGGGGPLGGAPGNHPQYTRYSLILFSTIAMIVKIYFLCVVWKCYRYLRLIELVSPIRLSEIYPHTAPAGPHGFPVVRVLGSIDSTDLSSGHNVTPPPYESIASSMKPPNYEEAIKSSGAVFTIDNTQQQQQQPHQQQQQQQQQPQQAQQTMVFTVPSSEQYPTTQVIVTSGSDGTVAAASAGVSSGSGIDSTRAQANSSNVSNSTNNSSSSNSARDSTSITIRQETMPGATNRPNGQVSSSATSNEAARR